MKLTKTFGGLAVAALAACVLAIVLYTASPLFRDGEARWFLPRCDVALTLTELKCLRMGVNPYDVWHGDVVVKGMRPNFTARGIVDMSRYGEDDEEVNIHTPWAYTALLPLGFLPMRAAVAAYLLVDVLCLGLVFAVGLYWGRRLGMDAGWRMLMGAVPLLAVSPLVFMDFQNGNMAIFVLAATALMSVCLDRGRDVLAGLCWAVAMMKPQTGLVFAVPLLMQRKWRACFTAAAACLLASLPPALMCRTSPLTLILQTPGVNAFQFWGCGTFPHFLLAFVPQGTAIFIGLAVGAAVCAGLTHLVCRVRPEAISAQGGGAVFSDVHARRPVLPGLELRAAPQPHDGVVLLPLPRGGPAPRAAFARAVVAGRPRARRHVPRL